MNDFTDGTLGYAQFAAQSTLRLGRPNSDENPLDKVFRQNDVGSILADGKAAIPVCIPGHSFASSHKKGSIASC
jgi:hypothetical protein